MNVKQICCGSGAALLLFALGGPAMAENARLPYHRLYSVQKAQTQWNLAHTNLVVVMTLQSIQPCVKPTDLAMFIDDKNGKIPVVIHPTGDFTIPLRDDLLAEDPWVISNQPKGTMKFSWKLGVIPGAITKSFHYARLMQPVQDSQTIQDQMRGFFPGSPKMTLAGLKLTFPPAPKTPVVIIHARDGDRKLKADAQGQVVIPLVSELLEENPEISLSDLPGTLEIVSH